MAGLVRVGSDPAPGSRLKPQPIGDIDNIGVQALNQASEALRRSANYEAQSAGKRGALSSNTLQAIGQQSSTGVSSSMQANAAQLQGDLRKLQTDEANKTAQKQTTGFGLSGIAKAVTGYLETNIERDRIIAAQNAKQEEIDRANAAASKKEKAAQAYANASIRLQMMKANWDEREGWKEAAGVQTLRTTGENILKEVEADLEPEQRRQLANELYGDIDKEYGTQSEKARKFQDEIVTTKRSLAVANAQLKAQEPMSSWRNARTVEQTKEAQGRFDNVVTEIMDDPTADDLTKYTALKTIYSDAVAANAENYQTQAELNKRLAAVDEYIPLMLQFNERRRSPGADLEAIDAEEQRVREALGVPSTFKASDPHATANELERRLTQDQSIQKLYQNNIIDDVQKRTLDNSNTGYLAYTIIKNPKVLNDIKAAPNLSANPGIQGAMRAAEVYNDVQKQNSDIDLRITGVRQAKAAAQQGAIKYLISSDPANRPPSINQMLERLGIGDITQEQLQGLTPLQQETLSEAWSEAQSLMDQEIAQLENRKAQNLAQLSPFGLDKPLDVLDKTMPERGASYTRQVEEWERVSRENTQIRNERLGISSPTNATRSNARPGGTQALMSVPLKTGDKNSKIVLPFAAGTKNVTVSQGGAGNYAQQRPTHTHAGTDIAVGEGTQLVSYTGGKVLRAEDRGAYGYMVDILGDDGMVHRFAHLQKGSITVRVGQRVEPGDKFGKTGSTGRSSGPHLHWEIRDPKKEWGFEGTVNPMTYLTGQTHNDSVVKRPRGDTTGWEYKEGEGPRVPKNAVPLGGGRYILNGRVGYLKQPERTPETVKYSSSAPLVNGQMPKERSAYPAQNDPTANHGYAAIARDEKFLRKTAQISDKLGIPAVWLVDVMAYETGGTFDTGIKNAAGSGATGLIQFMPETAAAMGYTVGQLASMSREKQLDVVYEYLKPFKKDLHKGPEYVLMAVFGGQGGINALNKGGNMKGWADGSIDFPSYVNKLGSGAGRQYNTRFSRGDRLLARTHTSYTANCKMCEGLRQANTDIVPHRSQMA